MKRNEWILTTKIYELRKEYKVSQTELAKIVGVRRETINCLEKGKYNPSLKLAMGIAHYFGRNIEDIFCITSKDDEK